MFSSMEAVLYPLVSKFNAYLSSYILVFLLIAVGLWYSVKTNFVQIRCFGEGMKKVFGNLTLRGGKQDSGMTSFQALATAIAAQVQHCRRFRRNPHRRPRRHLLDVGNCVPGHGYHLCRGNPGPENPCCG